MSARVHTPGLAGCDVDAKKTAVVFIEYQNEFTTEGGKLHEAVKGTMGGMIGTSVGVAEAARAAGATVMHAPISFKEDASDNPNKGVGILAGCAGDKLFTEGTRKLGVGFGLGRPHLNPPVTLALALTLTLALTLVLTLTLAANPNR